MQHMHAFLGFVVSAKFNATISQFQRLSDGSVQGRQNQNIILSGYGENYVRKQITSSFIKSVAAFNALYVIHTQKTTKLC
jgi:hypothetical protein